MAERMKKHADVARFRRFLETHDASEMVDALWWCGGGRTWESRDYRVVLLTRAEVGRGRSHRVERAVVELCAESADALAVAMAECGVIPPPVERIATLCESAPVVSVRRRIHERCHAPTERPDNG